MKNLLINSFIIHSRPYSETSIIFDILTESNGLISLIAKGIKKKKDGLLLKPFKELQLSYTSKGSVPILTKFEIINSFSKIKNKYLLIGLYFNELIYKFIPKSEPLPSLYSLYKNQLEYMKTTKDMIIKQLESEIQRLKLEKISGNDECMEIVRNLTNEIRELKKHLSVVESILRSSLPIVEADNYID